MCLDVTHCAGIFHWMNMLQEHSKALKGFQEVSHQFSAAVLLMWVSHSWKFGYQMNQTFQSVSNKSCHPKIGGCSTWFLNVAVELFLKCWRLHQTFFFSVQSDVINLKAFCWSPAFSACWFMSVWVSLTQLLQYVNPGFTLQSSPNSSASQSGTKPAAKFQSRQFYPLVFAWTLFMSVFTCA